MKGNIRNKEKIVKEKFIAECARGKEYNILNRSIAIFFQLFLTPDIPLERHNLIHRWKAFVVCRLSKKLNFTFC